MYDRIIEIKDKIQNTMIVLKEYRYDMEDDDHQNFQEK